MKKYFLLFVLFLNGCLLDFEDMTEDIFYRQCDGELQNKNICIYHKKENPKKEEDFLSFEEWKKKDIAELAAMCVDFKTSEDHCGKCGLACDEKAECAEGVCACPQRCQQGSSCNARGKCVCRSGDAEIPEDELTTNENCGYCGNKCAESTTCQINPNNGKYGCLCSNGKSTCFGFGVCTIDINGDRSHCGFCENNCVPENGKELAKVAMDEIACENGVCQYPCKENYGNCDSDNDNGCEVMLSHDTEHCGACGNNCKTSVQNAVSIQCRDGKCDYGACADGFLDLDNKRDNGCEHDASSDVNHCGNAGIDCKASVLHAIGIQCVAGACDYEKCENDDFLDLDNNRNNGCEEEVDDKAKYCGKNGTNCYATVKNVDTVLCNDDGECDYKSCVSEQFVDANENRADGCEHNPPAEKCAADISAIYNCNVLTENAHGAHCDAGKCDYTECLDKWLDLDDNRANGCEVNTLVTVNHCGKKDNHCADVLHQEKDIKCANGSCDYASCAEDHADRDNNRSNGCEADLLNDINHCGKIDIDCNVDVKNAYGVKCENRACNYFACHNNFLDLDRNRANGCEHDARNDIIHCGSEDINCKDTLQNVEDLKCEHGQCNFKTCMNGYMDLDKNRANGCEMSHAYHAESCGPEKINCHNVVRNTNGIKCVDELCSYDTCLNMFLDLDGDRANGCEVETLSDVEHCGVGNINCITHIQNATGKKCVQGMCSYSACNAGFSDDDDNPSNGCEINRQINAEHCGNGNINCANIVVNATDIKCVAGRCDYVACKDGYLDHDKDRTNGCESVVEP